MSITKKKAVTKSSQSTPKVKSVAKKAVTKKVVVKKVAVLKKPVSVQSEDSVTKSATVVKEPVAVSEKQVVVSKKEVSVSVEPTPTKTYSAKTMADLMDQVGDQIVIPKRGDVVVGVVTNVGKKMLQVDIGAKTEGIVTDKEFAIARDYIVELKSGQKIDVMVVSEENNQGQVMLSLKRAALDSKWDFFQDALDHNKIMDAKGLEVNKGGLIAVINGVRGFVPSSQFGKALVGKFGELKGVTFQVRAIEVDREKNRLIFSERHVSEADELANKEKALHLVDVGGSYEGVVSGVMHFGLFVTVEIPVENKIVGHVEGLVHISEISWEKVTHPRDYHRVGDRIKVKVLGIDEKTNKLNLSIKQLSDDPWTGIEDRYQSGTTLTGTVSRIENFGVFVNVEEGIDGLIHSSKLTAGQILTKGDTVTVHVESVSATQKRMSLSLVMTELPVEYR
ncbi:S1 RNA-binding domain-containing protein [Patescibacteria group bacterium]|nr:S1 RNA-binding domain-containing protein [Patescibacteria group bacterium]